MTRRVQTRVHHQHLSSVLWPPETGFLGKETLGIGFLSRALELEPGALEPCIFTGAGAGAGALREIQIEPEQELEPVV
ncbi:unnamed protein product [Clavelina lepadiformis]|uniref:Uncharacterized protein n=1 Tax=Clavelina lepadiformis TaxID=159417 RepID=A0ABP0F8N7_CLALP